jgi:TonB family protein
MKSPKKLVVMAALISCACAGAFAGDIKIIANPNVKTDTISGNELRSIFLEEKISLADGTHIEPVLQKSGTAHEKFLQEYVGKNADDLRTYYRSLVFSGRASMPKEFGSDAEVAAYVARTRGAIAYVDNETSAEGVKVLTVVEPGLNATRKLITRVEPDYPETLKRLGIGGIVRLQVTISAKGNVERVELLGGNPVLGEAAISAVRQWVYATGHSRTIAEVTIPFNAER